MGLMDRIRGRSADGTGDDDDAAGAEAGGAGDADQMSFAPRTDGRYLAPGSTLQFAGRTVRETDAADVVRSGEYTAAGRFLLSAPPQPSVAITVTGVTDDSFTARRTAVADRTTESLEYRFAPSAPPEG